VTGDTLAVIPAQKMTSFGDILATRHRVLLKNTAANESNGTTNITLSLSVIDRPDNLASNGRGHLT